MKPFLVLACGASALMCALVCTVAVASTVPASAVPGGPGGAAHGLRAKHHREHRAAVVAAAASADENLLDANDARFFLTRTGFAPDGNEVEQYVGLTREQAVEKVLAGARTDTVTPPPSWIVEPIPTRDERKAWTPDQRRDEQRQRNER
ncbi:MAG: DUF1800 domain-containing protein, partial [Paraburkholderia sp.]|nr:DUF1800 domain-containing protein [Paraburkholderia sp.]